MASSKSWIPNKEQDLVTLMGVWQVKLPNASLQSAYGWVATECTATVAALASFITARNAYEAAPIRPNLLVKNSAKAAAIAAMRKFAAERIRNNSKMNPGQRDELGVHTRDPKPTPVPVPLDGPDSEAEVHPKQAGLVLIRYKGSKPYGVELMEIAMLVSETPIESPEFLVNREVFPRNPWKHVFSDAERGRKLYYALRYVTKEGVSGWSTVQEVTIP
ncbi:MAG: hypothetical protein LBE06_09950 [Azoarcus sp.]|nr:hypothetical protein [Azoarcus sp.]